MYIYQDVIKDSFPELVKQLKISQILQSSPELIVSPDKINHRLKYMSSLHYPMDERIIVKLVDVTMNSEYWKRQIGNIFRMTCSNYSVHGMGLVSTKAGCITMDEYNSKNLIFEIIAMPMETPKREKIW